MNFENVFYRHSLFSDLLTFLLISLFGCGTLTWKDRKGVRIMQDVTNAISQTISISMFNRGLAGRIFEDVKKSGAKVVVKNNKPECVLLSPDEYVKLMDELNDARLLALANERMTAFDPSNVILKSDVLNELDLTTDELAEAEEVEIV